jgi:hypothetical protein
VGRVEGTTEGSLEGIRVGKGITVGSVGSALGAKDGRVGF